MPRRQVLSDTERENLLALPDGRGTFIQYYTLSERDLAIISLHRGDANRLGFAIQLCYMRYPGILLGTDENPNPALLNMVTKQLNILPDCWIDYGQREQTRREHITEIENVFGFQTFAAAHYRKAIHFLDELARQTDKGIIIATALVAHLRSASVLLPTINTIERICSASITRGTRFIYNALTKPLTDEHKKGLEAMLAMYDNSNTSILLWLCQSPQAYNGRRLLEHIERVKIIEALQLPAGMEKLIHQNRLIKLAREGSKMTAQHLKDLEITRRYATLVAAILEARATLIDEIIDIHDRIIGHLFNHAKNTYEKKFQQSGKAINDKVRLFCSIGKILMETRQNGEDPFAAIETIIPWADFTQSITEAEQLSRPESFDYIEIVKNNYSQIRRYAPALLEVLRFKAAPVAKDIVLGIEKLKELDAAHVRKLPPDLPIGFVRKRWETLVFKENGIDRTYYELCLLSELKNALRSGDVWVAGSRQFKDFETYLLPSEKFALLKEVNAIPLPVNPNIEVYLPEKIALLKAQLEKVNRLAAKGELVDVTLTPAMKFKIPQPANAVPKEAESFTDKVYSLLPRIKITDLLMEVDSWTGFTKHFTHIKTGNISSGKTLLLTAILSDAVNLGLVKMAESCPGTTYAKLAWLQAWHIRDDTYADALSELVNAQYHHPFAANWGDGTTSSSDGQRFKTGSQAKTGGIINPKYGSEPGVQFYTHISDQYIPFHIKVINVGVRDATYVLDGLLYHESDMRIEEHYTDTSGFTDHVFALMHLLGFKFAPRIKDMPDKKLYIYPASNDYPALDALIGGAINLKHIQANWDDVLRLATSIQQGVVTASLLVRKIGSYPRQNGLALALRELGKIERTLFMLEWFTDPVLRRRVTAGLNKGEARNTLARAVYFNRLGEMRDRSIESQSHRASGLTLVTAAIIYWNTVYIERAVEAMKEQGYSVDENLLQHLSPLGWEHIGLTGDYVWQQNKQPKKGKFRPLRPMGNV